MKLNKAISSIILLSSILLLLVGCGPVEENAQADFSQRKIKITTTTGMIGDLVKNIGKDRVEVKSLMGPGVDPHLYKPSAGDIRKLEDADIIFYNGLELEGRMTDTFVKIARSGKPTYAIAEEIDPGKLRQPKEFEGKYDPHIWFDVTLWQEAARKVEQELSELDPSSQEAYQKNLEDYQSQLDELHQYTKDQIALIPEQSRVLITAHDAFGYFGQQYGMQVRGLQGTSTATEAGAGDVQELAAFIAENKIKAIFIESSIPQSTIEVVQAAVKSKGWDVSIGGQLYSDAMGEDGTVEGTYIGMVRHNVDTISTALR